MIKNLVLTNRLGLDLQRDRIALRLSSIDKVTSIVLERYLDRSIYIT